MVKLNDEEIVIITHWYASEITDMTAQMYFLKSKFNLDRICVTRGENGAILMDDNGLYAHDGFSIEVADTIGSGDAFLACLLKNLLCAEHPQKAIENACAMGAIVASHYGATPTVEDEKIKKLFK